MATVKQSGPGVGRRLMRAVRHGPDRILHPFRRRTARRLLSSGAVRVVFVCHGNICRSPYAAAVFERAVRARGGPDVVVTSAGLMGPGRAAPEEAQRVARARGVDLETHRSRLVEAADGGVGSVIVVMEPWQERAVHARSPGARVVLLGDLDPGAIDTRAVIDPINRDDAFFGRVYDRIDRCVTALASAVLEGRR